MVHRELAVLSASLTALVARDIQRTLSLPVCKPTWHTDRDEVSVLVPARNEARRIGRLLEGLLRQQSRNFEVIVLNDHSDDGTGDVVRAWSNSLTNLRVIEGADLPSGWSGKCWACWQAAQASTAPWLLFLDADTAPQPELIGALLARAEEQELALLTIIPFVEAETFWERLLIPAFGALIQVVFPPADVNEPASRLAMANGPCILVRREVYGATGGHATVRGSILEDVELGQVVKHAGFRIELAAAPDLLHVRLYTGLGAISEGLQKNAWAGYRAGGWRSAWAGLRQILLSLTPLVQIVIGFRQQGTSAGRCFLAHGLYGAAMTTAYWGWYVHRVHRMSVLWGVSFPFGFVGYFILAGRAWWKLLQGKGVSWKGRAYGIR